jgi:serine/threonine protein kinase
VVDFDDIFFVSNFRNTVHLVQYNGEKCVYKFIKGLRDQAMYEKEFENYLLVQDGGPEAPRLIALVKRNERIRGFLCEYIEGETLRDFDFTEDPNLLVVQLNEWTTKILDSLTVLEGKGLYLKDIRASNIIRRKDNGRCCFVDLGGPIWSVYVPPVVFMSPLEYIPSVRDWTPKEYVYVIGRLIWHLWADEIPRRDIPDTVPEPVRMIIRNCCVDWKYNLIQELRNEWLISVSTSLK